LDPNYLHESELANSPFHQAFHKFILKNVRDLKRQKKLLNDKTPKHIEFKNSEVLPLFHIDFHGKLPKEIWTDPVAAVNLDFATLSLRNYMTKKDQTTLVTPISDFITKNFNQIYKD
jgi:hypothetical protein